MAVGDKIFLGDMIANYDGEKGSFRAIVDKFIGADPILPDSHVPILLETSYLYTKYGTCIYKIDRTTGVIVATSSAIASITYIKADADYIYTVGNNVAIVYKLNKTTLEVAGSYTAASNVSSLDIDDNYVYLGTADGKILRLTKSTMALYATYTASGDVRRLAVGDTYVYTHELNASPNYTKICKIIKSTMTLDIYTTTTTVPVTTMMMVYRGLLVSNDVRNLDTLELIHTRGFLASANIFLFALDGDIIYLMNSAAVASQTITKYNIQTNETLGILTHIVYQAGAAVSYLLGDGSGTYITWTRGLCKLVDWYSVVGYEKL